MSDIKALGIAIVAVLCCVAIMLTAARCVSDTKDREGYAAWVKLTDNPKKLTFEEWRSLVYKPGINLQQE